MTPSVEAFVNEVYDEIKGDFLGISEFDLKSRILDHLRRKAEAQADALIEVAQAIELVKIIKQLVELQN